MTPLTLCYIGPADSVTTRRWVEWFARRGHDTTILTVEPAESRTPMSFRQIDLRVGGLPRKVGRLWSVLRLARTLRSLNPDVVHVHYARGLPWGLLVSPRHPCVVTPWGSDVLIEQGAFREPLSRRLTRGLLGLADLVTAHSAYMEARVRPLKRATTPLVRVGWGVDLARFRPGLDVRVLRERWDIRPDQRVILSPRLAQPCYQHERVIRALPAVREKVAAALLVIPQQFAVPDYVASLRRLAAELSVSDAVRVIPAIPYAEMPLWLNLADAVVMVPRSDGMPNTLWEAMACGAAPVLNRLPQYEGVIRHGVNGCLVDPDGDLAGALIGLLGDPALRSMMAEHNATLVREQGDQDREMARMEEWYYTLAGRRSYE